MVGRMGDQLVVIRAEKGRVKMLVDGQDATDEKELVHDARKDIDHKEEKTQKGLRPSSENHSRHWIAESDSPGRRPALLERGHGWSADRHVAPWAGGTLHAALVCQGVGG